MPNVEIDLNSDVDTSVVAEHHAMAISTNSSSDIPVSIQVKNVDTSVGIVKTGNVDIKLSSYAKHECTKIFYNTTYDWNQMIGLIPLEGTFYVYSDYKVINGVTYPGFKIGDGKTYLSDLPFIDKPLFDHVNDKEVHITKEDRKYWNNKVSASVDAEKLILKTKGDE